LREFSTEDEAIDYAIHLQRDRRNMTDAELMACISALDQRRERGGNRRTEEARSNTQDCVIEKPKSSSKETAEKLGISARKVEQARTIEDHADPDVKEAVQSGEMSINKAYNETQKRRKESKGEPVQAQPQNSETEDEVDESQQDTTVKLLERHYTSLLELGGSVDDHVAWAIDMYLSSDSQGNYQHTTTVAL
jgi:ParB family chromosome partitioning protein